MRLLLDEMISASVAAQLRARGHDVVAVQDPALGHLRGVDDCVLIDHAAEEHRAVVTDNIPDVVRCHQRRLVRDKPHFGLLLFTNDTFPRHRHDAFVGQLLAARDPLPRPAFLPRVHHDTRTNPGEQTCGTGHTTPVSPSRCHMG